MRLNNVFYGFTKDGQRKLLWKRYKTEYTSMGDVSRTIYYDLENNDFIEPNEVDESTLTTICNIIGTYKRKSKRKVVEAYKADCNLTFDITGAFYGNIVEKTTNYALKSANGYFIGSAGTNLYDEVFLPIEENILFVKTGSLVIIENIKNSKTYPWYGLTKSGFCVKRDRPINRDKIRETVVSKKKLLELDYKKEL